MKSNQTIGIVLSGGGMRGLAHIGLLKALRENGIEPKIVSGTSAGALVGAMYAYGYTEEEMLEFFKKIPLFSWSFFTWSKSGLLDSDKFQSYFESYFPEDDFSALKKPLFITATDIVNVTCRFFSAGSMIRPLMASAALPPVFSPMEIDGTLYVDGGIMNIFPVEVLVDQCDKIIGSFVNPLRRIDKKYLNTTRRVSQRALDLRFYSDSKNKFRYCDFLVEPRLLSRVGLFDRSSMKKAFKIGYEAGIKNMDKILETLEMDKTTNAKAQSISVSPF